MHGSEQGRLHQGMCKIRFNSTTSEIARRLTRIVVIVIAVLWANLIPQCIRGQKAPANYFPASANPIHGEYLVTLKKNALPAGELERALATLDIAHQIARSYDTTIKGLSPSLTDSFTIRLQSKSTAYEICRMDVVATVHEDARHYVDSFWEVPESPFTLPRAMFIVWLNGIVF